MTLRGPVVILAGLLLSAPTGAHTSSSRGLGHYVFFGLDRERITEPAFVETAAFTVEELVAYARDPLHLDYLCWGTAEPYWSTEVLPDVRLSKR